MCVRRCRFIPQIDFLSRRIVLSAGAVDASAVIAPAIAAHASADGSAIDGALGDLYDGSSSDEDPGSDPMAPQLPSDMEYTTATPVLCVLAYS